MCLIAFAHDCHPRYRLILAANRDEFRERLSQTAHWWEALPLFGGRDLVAAGTWLGVGRDGRLAAVTNVRNPADQVHGGPSRGALIVDYLARPQGAQDYVATLTDLSIYAPFNLLLFDATSGIYLSNRSASPQPITPGIHALSNATLDTPWPKVRKVKAGLAQLLKIGEPITPAVLFSLLADTTSAADPELPATGIPLDLERRLSAIQIPGSGYGTRSTTVVLIGRDNRVEVVERTFGDDPAVWSEVRECWSID